MFCIWFMKSPDQLFLSRILLFNIFSDFRNFVVTKQVFKKNFIHVMKKYMRLSYRKLILSKISLHIHWSWRSIFRITMCQTLPDLQACFVFKGLRQCPKPCILPKAEGLRRWNECAATTVWIATYGVIHPCYFLWWHCFILGSSWFNLTCSQISYQKHAPYANAGNLKWLPSLLHVT